MSSLSLSDVLLNVPWPSYLFIVISLPSVLLYISLLSTVISKRAKFDHFRTTYYNLVIAQGIVDIAAMFLYFVTYIPRAFDIATNFYWDYRNFVAPFSFNHSMFFLIVRCYENALMALQRYFVHFDLKDAVRDIRTYFPIITGFESYSTVWLHILLNKDLRFKICPLCCRTSSEHQTRPSDSRSRRSPRGVNEADRLKRSSNEILPIG